MVDIIGATLKSLQSYLADRENAAGDIETAVVLDSDGDVKVNTAGVRTLTVPSSAASSGKYYENITVTNPTGKSGYAIRYAANVHTGQRSDGVNEISDALIARYSDVTTGPAWLRWNVMTSPLKEGSGITGAPVSTQGFYMLIGEDNPQNRWDNGSWQRETRLMGTGVGGWQMVAETQDFSGLLGNTRVGYNIHFGYAIGRSPYTDTILKKHAKFYNGYMVIPNSIAAAGYAFYAYGYRQFMVDIAIATAGSGYAVGNILTLASGLNQNQNEDAQVIVTAVNGSGGVTAANLYNAGSFTTSPSATLGVTGGAGTGAEFTWTMSTEATERPRAAYGSGGRWEYGLNFAEGSGGNSVYHLTTSSGYSIHLANGEKIGARNAANSATIEMIGVNASDQVTLAGKSVLAWADYTPTINGNGSTAYTTSNTVSAKYARINDTVFFEVVLQITTKGAATYINVTPPVATSAVILALGRNITTGAILSGYKATGGTTINFAGASGGDPAADATFYVFSGSYRVA